MAEYDFIEDSVGIALKCMILFSQCITNVELGIGHCLRQNLHLLYIYDMPTRCN